jgi:hypothetical protein
MPKSVRGVLHEFKEGALHSGSSTGPVVKNRKQAIAIAISEQRQPVSKGRHGGYVEMTHHGNPGRKPTMRHGSY